MENRSYLIIDLKSFYASCECVMRGLDPMTTDLVVAEERARQQTTLALHQRFGKNALLRATDLLAAATRRERNEQIGGHKAYGNQETVEPRKNLPALRRAAGAAGKRSASMKRGTMPSATNPKRATRMSKSPLHRTRCLIMMKATRSFNGRR